MSLQQDQGIMEHKDPVDYMLAGLLPVEFQSADEVPQQPDPKPVVCEPRSICLGSVSSTMHRAPVRGMVTEGWVLPRDLSWPSTSSGNFWLGDFCPTVAQYRTMDRTPFLPDSRDGDKTGPIVSAARALEQWNRVKSDSQRTFTLSNGKVIASMVDAFLYLESLGRDLRKVAEYHLMNGERLVLPDGREFVCNRPLKIPECSPSSSGIRSFAPLRVSDFEKRKLLEKLKKDVSLDVFDPETRKLLEDASLYGLELEVCKRLKELLDDESSDAD